MVRIFFGARIPLGYEFHEIYVMSSFFFVTGAPMWMSHEPFTGVARTRARRTFIRLRHNALFLLDIFINKISYHIISVAHGFRPVVRQLTSRKKNDNIFDLANISCTLHGRMASSPLSENPNNTVRHRPPFFTLLSGVTEIIMIWRGSFDVGQNLKSEKLFYSVEQVPRRGLYF